MTGFRAWDKVNKCYDTESGLFIDPQGRIMLYDIHDISRRNLKKHVDVTDRYDIEWVTGKVDENGKMIYEGDRVNWYAEELASDGERTIRYEYKNCEVFWHEEFVGLMLRQKDKLGAWHFYENMKIEIYGTIHEEPKL